jgi:hypothetical protein
MSLYLLLLRLALHVGHHPEGGPDKIDFVLAVLEAVAEIRAPDDVVVLGDACQKMPIHKNCQLRNGAGTQFSIDVKRRPD